MTELSRPPLVDAFGRVHTYLRLSVTDRCNLRCTYCMPAETFDAHRFLPRSKVLRFEEIERLARLFAGFGVRKLRITGGEPLLRRELPTLIGRLASIDGIEDIALTTNGLLFADQAAALRRAGLGRVSFSLDALDPARFSAISGRPESVLRVLEAVERAVAMGFDAVKINCVVERGVNEDEILPMAEYFRGRGVVLRFIEYMDVGTQNQWSLDRVVPATEILDRVARVYPLEAVAPRHVGEVARRYRYADGAGEMGVIASVTAPFCGDCQRARLTTDGRFFLCLFGSAGIDLRSALRHGESDRTIREMIRDAWRAREDRYSELRGRSDAPRERIEMYELGG